MRNESNEKFASKLAAIVALGGVGLAVGGCTEPVPTPAGNFVDSWCNVRSAGWQPPASGISPHRGMYDMVYDTARYEGYQWGGGCWNDNNLDDSPGDPPQVVGTKGEGPDCSGLVMKAWGLRTDAASNRSFVQWSDWDYPLAKIGSGSFTHDSESWKTIPKGDTDYWDAFAKNGHIGLVRFENGDGTDQIFEAKGEAYGTNVWSRDYRTDPAYVTSRRIGWEG